MKSIEIICESFDSLVLSAYQHACNGIESICLLLICVMTRTKTRFRTVEHSDLCSEDRVQFVLKM